MYIYVFAKHISYDLVDNVIEDSYIKNKSGDAAISWILSNTQYTHKFTGNSNISKRNNARYVFKNPIEALISDDDNSFINRWGGEIVRDNFNISMLQRRGRDKGVSIRYRKNLKGINFETDYSNIVTRAMIKGYDGLKLPEEYIDSKLLNNYIHPKISEIKYDDIKLKSNSEDEEGFNTLEECYAEMRNRIEKEYENGLDKPNVSATVDFIELSKTEEYKDYKNLERLGIGDYVHIYIDEFNLDVTEKVISTVYDPILDKYTSFELGQAFKSYTLENKEYKTQLEEFIIPNALDEAKQNATNLLTTALGGFVVKTRNELFIMDNEDMNKAMKIWRWNLNGLGYSKSGINGPYELAMTQDGRIVADFITTGQMSVQRISGLSSTLSNVTTRIELLEDGIELAVTKKNVFAAINLGVKEKQGIINLEGNIVTIKSDKTTLDQNGKLTTSEIIATGGQIAGLTMSHEQNGSYLSKNYKANNVQYQSGFYIPDSGSGSSIFLYAGCPPGGYLVDSNLYIRHDGLIKAKWFEVNGESGYFYVNYNSNRRAMTLSKTGIDFLLDNTTNNNFASMTYGSQYWNFILYDAPNLSITDGVHDRMALTYEKYNPSSSNNLSKVGDVFWLNSVLYVNGNRYNNLNNTIYIQGYEVATNASDERLKENKVKCKENSLEVTDKIPIISFDWKKDVGTRDAGKHIRFGYGAQRTKKVFEDGVNYSIENDTYQMNLLNLSALHHKNIQEIHSWMRKIEKTLKI